MVKINLVWVIKISKSWIDLSFDLSQRDGGDKVLSFKVNIFYDVKY